MKNYKTGTSTWTYGDPCHYENGKPMNILLGPCPECGTPCFDYGGGWRCNSLSCSKSVNNPSCDLGNLPTWWTEPINVYLDGNSWCATYDDFEDLQISPAGFGDSPKEAIENLKELMKMYPDVVDNK